MIRPLRARDIPACIGIIRAAYDIASARYAEIEINQGLAPHAPKPAFVVYEVGRDICGLAGYCPSGVDFGIWSLMWVNVRAPLRKQGIGAKLVSHCLAEMTLFASAAMLATTIPAWYEKHWGFRRVYEYGGDHTLMCKELDAPGAVLT